MSNIDSNFWGYALAMGFAIALAVTWDILFKKKQITLDQAEKIIAYLAIFAVILLTLYFHFSKGFQ